MSNDRFELPLSINNQKFYYNPDRIGRRKEMLEKFSEGMYYMNSPKFAHKVLFTHELQANNTIEGYKDDVGTIYNAIFHNLNISDPRRRLRILNLYKAYLYILKGKPINRETLKELYTILSEGLLDFYQNANMGEYYRKDEVVIDLKGKLTLSETELQDAVDALRKGVGDYETQYKDRYKDVFVGAEVAKIEEYMNELLNFMDDNTMFNTGAKTDAFVKSQILHFFFVYIHPYFDLNGRTARTVSMWYLLRNKAYPFIIFNRAINLNQKKYYESIRDVRVYHNMTAFLVYMMDNTLIELEKEHLMELISYHSHGDLTSLDYQNLHYILSMKGQKTYIDFCNYYNRYNERRSMSEIFDIMLTPLLDKGVIIEGGATGKKKEFSNFADGKNHTFSLNEDFFDPGDPKIQHLVLK